MTYNRQGQSTKRPDQAGTMHVYEYDLLDRPTQDRATATGTNVDTAVRRINAACGPLLSPPRLKACPL